MSTDQEKPAPAEKPIGPTDCRELAERAARGGRWEESVAWSSLGMLAMAMREDRRRGN
jgi:hypothetical protein